MTSKQAERPVGAEEGGVADKWAYETGATARSKAGYKTLRWRLGTPLTKRPRPRQKNKQKRERPSGQGASPCLLDGPALNYLQGWRRCMQRGYLGLAPLPGVFVLPADLRCPSLTGGDFCFVFSSSPSRCLCLRAFMFCLRRLLGKFYRGFSWETRSTSSMAPRRFFGIWR